MNNSSISTCDNYNSVVCNVAVVSPSNASATSGSGSLIVDSRGPVDT